MGSFSVDVVALEGLFTGVMVHLDERQRRILAGNVAISLGRGGITAVAVAAGMSRSTVQTAVAQIDAGIEVSDRVRAPGAGRKPILVDQPKLLTALDALVEPESRGDPMCSLRWTAKSVRNLAEELQRQGFTVSPSAVAGLLHYMEYSLQGLAKTEEGASHPDRDGQFRYLAGLVDANMAQSEPVISVDAKKKEQIGNFHNNGVERQPAGKPQTVNGHDFPDPELGKAIPYGVYDLGANTGWVSVGEDGDTAEFAVNTIATWWDKVGTVVYPNATRLLITADAGGSNSYRSRLWKRQLTALAARTSLVITVVHFPPGTSKWNKIEHRLFSHITMNWRGRPLTTHETVVNLIGNTKTRTGLTVHAEHDTRHYPTGIKISDTELKTFPITGHDFHPEWNYTITPPTTTQKTK